MTENNKLRLGENDFPFLPRMKPLSLNHQINENKSFSRKMISIKLFFFIMKFSAKEMHPKLLYPTWSEVKVIMASNQEYAI